MPEENIAVCWRFLELHNQGAWDQLDGAVGANYIHHSNDIFFILIALSA